MVGRKMLLIVIIVMTVAACASPNAVVVSRSTEPGVTTTALNLRQGPSTAWPVVTVLPSGTRVEIISRIGDWMQISYGRHAGYVAGRYVKSLAVIGLPATPSGGVEKFLPAHRRILEETGWLEYVTSHIDGIQYYDWHAFRSPSGPALGMAVIEDGRRIARIALKDRSEFEVTATIVHEAAHLSGIPQVGTTYSEEVAVAVEEQFRRAFDATVSTSRPRSGHSSELENGR